MAPPAAFSPARAESISLETVLEKLDEIRRELSELSVSHKITAAAVGEIGQAIPALGDDWAKKHGEHLSPTVSCDTATHLTQDVGPEVALRVLPVRSGDSCRAIAGHPTRRTTLCSERTLRCSEEEPESDVGPSIIGSACSEIVLLPSDWPESLKCRVNNEDEEPFFDPQSFGQPKALFRTSKRISGIRDKVVQDARRRGVTEVDLADLQLSLRAMGSTSSVDESGTMSCGFSFRGVLRCCRGRFWLTVTTIASDRFVLHPGSPGRVVLDILSVIVLSYDLMVTPFTVAWNMDMTGFLDYGNKISTVFWTLDLFAQFRTGYYDDGDLQLQSRAIAHHYIISWFPLDACVVIGDWISLILNAMTMSSSEFGSSRILRLFKVSRLLRLAGMFRMARISEQLKRLTHRFHTEALRNVIQIVLLLFFIFWCNHVLGCVWYAIGVYGAADSDTGASWLDDTINAGDWSKTYEDLGIYFQYTTSLHWSITQMTPGSIPLQPLNSSERVFNIACLIFGLLFFSTVISSLSAQMTQIKMMSQERFNTIATLDRFLRDNAVSGSLGVSVKRQVEERMLQRKPLGIEDVHATNFLSLPLLKQLRTELCRPHLMRSQFFRLVEQVDNGVFQDLCRNAVEFVIFMQQDHVIDPSREMSNALHIMRGRVLYVQEPSYARVEAREETTVPSRSWLCWAALWSQWFTVGTAEAATVCELLSVKSAAMVRIVSRNPALGHVCRGYCMAFHQRLVSAKPPAASWPSDLEVPFTEHPDVVILMNRQRRSLIGFLALEALQSHWHWRLLVKQHDLEELTEEVQSGKSTLAESSGHAVERLVAVAVLCLKRDDGRVLVQLGKWEEGSVVPKCTLPGSKLHDCELPVDAVQRVLQEELWPFAHGVRKGRVEQVVESRESARYRLKTRYVRTIQYATLSRDFVEPLLPTPIGVGSLPSNMQHHAKSDLFLLRVHKKTYLCAWIAQELHEALSSPSGDKALKAWVSSVKVDEIDSSPTGSAQSRVTDRMDTDGGGNLEFHGTGRPSVTTMSGREASHVSSLRSTAEAGIEPAIIDF